MSRIRYAVLWCWQREREHKYTVGDIISVTTMRHVPRYYFYCVKLSLHALTTQLSSHVRLIGSVTKRI